MITDIETNLLFLADTLPLKHEKFYKEFTELLQNFEIEYSLLPNTKDIWARDYMPVQIRENTFVQFNYNPDYLQSKRWRKTISSTDDVCKAIGLKAMKSKITLDGGNVIHSKDKVIMCDKIFRENSTVQRNVLIDMLCILFQVSKIIFIPTHSKNIFGHADGMMRFCNENTVLINSYSREELGFGEKLKSVLEKENLNWIEIPYCPYENKTHLSARGVYINYLQMKNLIVLPVFGMKADDVIEEFFQHIFYKENIITLNCNELAKEGGLLNCISWNILK